MDSLQVWDLIDLHLIEYPLTDYTWIIDPSLHHDDDFFSLKDLKIVSDVDAQGLPLFRKFMTLEFYKPGDFELNLIRIKKDYVAQIAKIGKVNQSYSRKTRIIDDRYILKLSIS
jgi:hypothetical protein